MKKKFTILLAIGLVVILLSGCTAITKMVTGAVIEDFLESDDGPKESIDIAFNSLLEDIALPGVKVNSIEDYNWSLQDSRVSASIGDPPGNTSGIMTAKDIKLTYNYTIIGEAKDGTGQDDIEKDGKLRFVIEEMVFDESNDSLVSMSTADAKDGDAPEISNIEIDGSPVILTADISNYEGKNPKAVAVIGLSEPYPVEDLENVEVEVGSISQVEVGILAAVNRAVMSDPDDEGTGIAASIFSIGD